MAIGKHYTKPNAEGGMEITLLDPRTNNPLPERITVYGSDSKVCREIQRSQTNHRIEQQAKQKNKKRPITSAEKIEAEGLDLLVGCTKSWRTVILDDQGKESGSRPQIELAEGEWLDCTPENVRRVYDDFPWIKEQVDEEIGDRTNFLPS
ncbi:MAG: hypothetical protein A2075_09075 [Geobacteraceae bacterium GWC2_58_44]|nr:MAG: hypothetical protein A2075_09075 [Geobacteraceae bacterium GWC2_58_44]HBG07665.1 hypothetical protein [Geobacter sp.]